LWQLYFDAKETGWDQRSEIWKICHGRLVAYADDAATGKSCKPNISIGLARAERKQAQRGLKILRHAIQTDPEMARCRPQTITTTGSQQAGKP
jgi:hypothetical protein